MKPFQRNKITIKQLKQIPFLSWCNTLMCLFFSASEINTNDGQYVHFPITSDDGSFSSPIKMLSKMREI